MTVSRRRFLALGAGGAAASALGLAGCGSPTSLGAEDEIIMWGWDRAIPDSILEAGRKKIPGVPGKKLLTTKIGGNYNTKVRTALAAKSSIPDIIMINSDVATYFPNADQFVDLNTLGAEKLKSGYLEWKWNQGVTPEGRMMAFPMDTGPTGLFYRQDILGKAGEPTDPAELTAQTESWDDFIALGRRLRKKTPESVLFATINEVWDIYRGSLTKSFMTKDDEYIGDGDHIREAWEMAYRIKKEGLSANARSTDANAIITTGRRPCYVDAVWRGAVIEDTVPKLAGKWRVAGPPGGPGNNGGSFLVVTKYATDPEAAFKTITWLQSPKTQQIAFSERALFPSSLEALESKALDAPQKYFGGQHTIDVFGDVAKQVPDRYLSPYENIIGTQFGLELPNVEAGTKTPDRAWKDAQHNVERELTRMGVV